MGHYQFARLLVLGVFALLACSLDSDGGDALPEGSGEGRFVDSLVDGLVYYEANTYPYQGVTTVDLKGKARITQGGGIYHFQPGSGVAFFLGPIELGIAGGPSTPLPHLRLYRAGKERWGTVEYGESDSPALDDTRVLNQARLLLALDEDGDPANGIEISRATRDGLFTLAGFPKGFFVPFDDPLEFPRIVETEVFPAASSGTNKSYSLPSLQDARAHLSDSLMRPTPPIGVGPPWASGQEACGLLDVIWDPVTFRGERLNTYHVHVTDHGLRPFKAEPTAVVVSSGDLEVSLKMEPGSYEVIVFAVRPNGVRSKASNVAEITVPDGCDIPPEVVTDLTSSGECVTFSGPNLSGTLIDVDVVQPDLGDNLLFQMKESSCSIYSYCKTGARHEMRVVLNLDGTGTQDIGLGLMKFHWGVQVDPGTCDPTGDATATPGSIRYNFVVQNDADGTIGGGVLALPTSSSGKAQLGMPSLDDYFNHYYDER